VNKWNLAEVMYVAWIDRLIVDCFGVFHMISTEDIKLHTHSNYGLLLKA